jgi:hypothetical protein
MAFFCSPVAAPGGDRLSHAQFAAPNAFGAATEAFHLRNLRMPNGKHAREREARKRFAFDFWPRS